MDVLDSLAQALIATVNKHRLDYGKIAIALTGERNTIDILLLETGEVVHTVQMSRRDAEAVFRHLKIAFGIPQIETSFTLK